MKESRRRFLQCGIAGGVIGLSGCVEVTAPGQDDDGTDDTDRTPTDDEADDGVEDATDDTADAGGEEVETTVRTFRLDEFRLSTSGTSLHVYGKLSARGIYDDDVYINPIGFDQWTFWTREDDESFYLDADSPTSIDNAGAVIEFPGYVIDGHDETDPFLIVRGDFIERRDGESNRYLGWDSARLYIEDTDGTLDGEPRLEFTEQDQDVGLEFTVTPLSE